MALFRLFQKGNFKISTDVLKIYSNSRNSSSLVDELQDEVQKSRKEEELPVEMPNPFAAEKPKCILCKYEIEPDFRNVRLLSQFVSSFTGRVYGRHITGLCEYKQEKVSEAIKKAQYAGLMGYQNKDPNFLADPDLYDFTKPFKYL